MRSANSTASLTNGQPQPHTRRPTSSSNDACWSNLRHTIGQHGVTKQMNQLQRLKQYANPHLSLSSSQHNCQHLLCTAQERHGQSRRTRVRSSAPSHYTKQLISPGAFRRPSSWCALNHSPLHVSLYVLTTWHHVTSIVTSVFFTMVTQTKFSSVLILALLVHFKVIQYCLPGHHRLLGRSLLHLRHATTVTFLPQFPFLHGSVMLDTFHITSAPASFFARNRLGRGHVVVRDGDLTVTFREKRNAPIPLLCRTCLSQKIPGLPGLNCKPFYRKAKV